MKLAIHFGVTTYTSSNEDWQSEVAYVVEAERLGVDSAWSVETWGYDGATPLAYLAAKTTSIRLGTGILQVGTRTPALTAMTAMALASLSGDRSILGLGVSGPQVIEGWHGVRFARSLQRLRETVEIVRKVTRGERLVYHGEIYNVPLPEGEGKALTSSVPPRPDLPVYLATLGPKSLELTGELADGWLGTSFIPEHASMFFDPIATGAAHAGRSLADLELQVAAGVVAFSDDVERLIRRCRRRGSPDEVIGQQAGIGDVGHRLPLLLRARVAKTPARLPADGGIDRECDAHVHGVAERPADQRVRPVY